MFPICKQSNLIVMTKQDWTGRLKSAFSPIVLRKTISAIIGRNEMKKKTIHLFLFFVSLALPNYTSHLKKAEKVSQNVAYKRSFQVTLFITSHVKRLIVYKIVNSWGSRVSSEQTLLL